MGKEIPHMGEKFETMIMPGALPIIKKNKKKKLVVNIENQELGEDKEVKIARKNLAEFISTELPFADESILEQMSSGQLLDLYLYYYNTPAKLEHFTTLYQRLKKESLSEKTDSPQTKMAYLSYLLNKQPTKLQENQLRLTTRKKINPELIEEIAEDSDYPIKKEELPQLQKMITWLESIHQARQEKKSNSFIGFHVAQRADIKGDIDAPHGIEQTNIESSVNEIHSGARFFTTTTNPLYYPGGTEQFLYMVFANQDDLTRMYDPSEKAVFSHGALERIPNNDLPPIYLTPEVLKDLDGKFGTS